MSSEFINVLKVVLRCILNEIRTHLKAPCFVNVRVKRSD